MPKLNQLLNTGKWTYGAEHEFSDWDAWTVLPKCYARSPDYTIVNSNGIAAQPNPKLYRYGGEINTPPTDMDGQVECLTKIVDMLPECSINHRSNLHIHIRVPGLIGSLETLKNLQVYIHTELPKIIDLLEPIPKGTTLAEKKREKRRRVSHHTFLTKQRLEKQLQAGSVKEFFELECPKTKDGKVMWHAQPRLAVGLRQLLQTDTIEFRHFPGTLEESELYVCLNWCRDFLVWALEKRPIKNLWKNYEYSDFPQFPEFDEELEIGYQATASHNGLSQSQIKIAIGLILRGEFNGTQIYKDARARARGLSR